MNALHSLEILLPTNGDGSLLSLRVVYILALAGQVLECGARHGETQVASNVRDGGVPKSRQSLVLPLKRFQSHQICGLKFQFLLQRPQVTLLNSRKQSIIGHPWFMW